jgi:mRNA-degrading endonuclease RelE of RelBE toxin-antitoxin system
MDKISKFIKKIDPKDASKIADVLERLSDNDLKNLDIKKLKGSKDIFRVRFDKYRIIYTNDGDIKILEISQRDENTYKNY